MTPMSWMRRLLCGAAAALAAFLIACALPASAVQQYEKDVVSFSETTLLKDAETRQHFLEEIEASFLKDYELLWKRENMLGKLTAAADAVAAANLSVPSLVNSQSQSLMWKSSGTLAMSSSTRFTVPFAIKYL